MQQNGLEGKTEISMGLHGRRRGLRAGWIAWVFPALLMALVISSPLPPNALASEGGSSAYSPGTYGDFAMNIVMPGLSIRENVMYTYGKLDNYPVGAPITGLGTFPASSHLDQKAWVNLIQAAYATKEFKILGGRYFANINIPSGFDAELTADIYVLPPIDASETQKDKTSGLGDIQAVPFGLVWDKGNLHLLAAENIIIPTGRYDVLKSANMGRNYWGYETLFGLTWLDEKRGHEASFTAGYLINNENKETHYKTGDEFHLDYTLAQYFSESCGVGVVGYHYQQITADSGSGYDDLNTLFSGRLDGYKSRGAGVGPALMWAPKIGGKPLNLIAKWIYEYEGTNRFMGGWLFLSAAMTF